MTRNASTVASIDSCLDELAEAGRGRNLLEDAIFGNYEVAYFSKSVDGDRDGIDKKRPATRTIPRALALGWLPRVVLRKAFRLDATFQHVVRPNVLVNFVRARVFGVPIAVTAAATFERLRPDAIAAIAASNGTALTSETAHVDFDVPRVSFGTRGRLNFELSGPSAQPPVDLCTPYVDDVLRVGLASRGGRFVFTRGDKADDPAADDWRALLDQPPVTPKTFLLATAAAILGAVLLPAPSLVAAPIALVASTRLVACGLPFTPAATE